MIRSEFLTLCEKIFKENRLPCPPEAAETFYRLTERMLEVNKSLNLTAITEEKAIILRHYVDSLLIAEHIPEGASVMDVGCGAGFPSLPLAIMRPDLRITALDGTAKRIRYVAETAELLGLANVTAMVGRAEEYGQKADYREQYTVVTARAVANLSVLCELCLPFVQVGGTMIAMKAKLASEELATAKSCVSLCGGGNSLLFSRNLTESENQSEERNLIIIPKIAPCPKIYPRHFSKISKKPL